MAMRILYLGKDYWKYASARSALFHTRFYHGLVRNGHFVYYFSGPTEARHLAPFSLKKIGAARAKARLLTIAQNFEPEAIVASQVGDYTDVLLELKSRMPHLRIAQMNVDPLFSTGNRENLMHSRATFDATFVTTGGPILDQFSTAKNTFYFVPNVTDTSIDTGRAFAHAQTTYDLCCFLHGAHQAKGDQERRITMAERAARDIPKERLLFGGFNGWPSRYGRPYFDGIANSAMTLNLNRDRWNGVLATPEERYLYTSDRTAHTMGNGSLALIERGYALETLYRDNEEAVFFSDAEELADKVTHLRTHATERQRIAKNGWQKAHRDFNEQIVMHYVLERLFNKPLSREYPWPTQ